jgi:fumarylpyruvate hydrolase
VTSTIFERDPTPTVEIEGTAQRFPVRRVYCVGRNYVEHAKEMGIDPTREPPFFFTKPADAVVPNGTAVSYPPRTANFHHEIELVIAIGKGGHDIAVQGALDHVYGYAVGNDLTCRDLQLAARDKGRPWDTGKAFDQSAVIAAIRPATRGHVQRGRIWLAVNGAVRQQGDVSQLIWNVAEIIAELSTFFSLAPGDLIYTGTPAGVGPLHPGDTIEGGIDSLQTMHHSIVTRTAA